MERALTVSGAPARSGEVDRARARVRALVEEILRLDLEVERLSGDLDLFAGRWDREVGPSLAELSLAEGLVERLQRAEDELLRIAAALRNPPRPRRRGARPPAPRRHEEEAGGDAAGAPGAEAAGGSEPEVLPEEVALKRLWRRLARLLHPDLARDEQERVRLSAQMAQVNAAYEAGDLAALEVVAERLGAGEEPDVGDAERLDHLERRAASLAAVRDGLLRERARLLATDTARLSAEAAARIAAGGDLLAESRAAALAEADGARADALARLDRVAAAARDLARIRRDVMDRLARRGPSGALRHFDPVAESPLVRQGALLLAARRAGPAARDLARRLEEQAQAPAPWEAALTLLAFLAEEAGSPPPSLSGAAELAAAWDAVREGWEGAPDLARALARLPRHLALGPRTAGRELPFGVHLADGALGAGVAIALRREPVAALARRVLAALGPELGCPRCRRECRAIHLLRARGVDEIHGLACPACGEVLRSYWQYGEPGGLEALATRAVAVGLVAELAVFFAGTAVGLQMLPAERQRLTAGGLARRFAGLVFAPYRVPVGARDLAVRAGGRQLRPRHPVPPGRVSVSIARGPADAEALELVRARVERRFRE